MSDHLNEVTALTNIQTAMGKELKEYLVVATLFFKSTAVIRELDHSTGSKPEEDLTLGVSYWTSEDVMRR